MAGKALAIGLLGPVQARLGTIHLPLGPRRQRMILAVLALSPGTVVPLERLLGLVWPGTREYEPAGRLGSQASWRESPAPAPQASWRESPAPAPQASWRESPAPAPQASWRESPAHRDSPARRNLQIATARLQSVLAEHATIVAEDCGYRLELTDAWTDVATFHRLTEQARDSSDPVAVRLLAEADRLWRGPALADVATAEVREQLCPGLQESRLVAIEERYDALLRLGRHREIIADLTAAVRAEPLRERRVGQLMLALHRTGQSPAALKVFDETADALDRQQGRPPGVALQTLRSRIADGDPELGQVTPRSTLEHLDAPVTQLPEPDGPFLGREETLRELDAAARRSSIAVLTGPGGIGKTQAALRWADRHRDDFPDGRLFIDLRGHSPGRTRRPVDVLAALLRALGTGIRQIPSDPDEAAAAFRSVVRGRRVLIVLDNVGRAGQVEPLLPGEPDCFVVITSRDPLDALVHREHAHRITLPALDPAAAAQLLEDDSAPVDPALARTLAERCGHLPLALRLTGAVLRADPDLPAAELLAEFGPDAAADPVRAAFAASYGRLAPREQRVFRLLGLVPGADLSLDAAAALTRLPPAQIAAALPILTEAHLVRRCGDRIALHDLMGQYALQLAADDAESVTARARLAEWYEMMTVTATGMLYPQHRVVLPGGMPVQAGRFADNAAAMQWLEREFSNLVAFIAAAAQLGPRPASWRIAAALSPYLRTDIPAAPIRLIAAAAASAAQVVEDLPGQAVANMTLAAAAKLDNEHEATERHLRRARRLASRAGWLSGEATALRLQGNLYGNLQRIRAAVRCCEESLEVYRQLSDRGGQAINLHNSGVMYFLLGDLPHARERAEQALALYESIDSLTGASKALAALSQVDVRLGRTRLARERVLRARELAERSEDLRALEYALTTLAELQHTVGEHEAAEDTLKAARSTGTTNPYTAIIAGYITAGAAYARGDFARALAECETALAAATRLGAASFATQLQLRRAAGLSQLGRHDDALAAATEGIQNAVTHEFGIQHALGQVELGWIRLARGEFAEAAAAAGEGRQLADRLGDQLGVAHARAALSAVLEATGDIAEARQHRRAAAAFFDATDIPADLRRL